MSLVVLFHLSPDLMESPSSCAPGVSHADEGVKARAAGSRLEQKLRVESIFTVSADAVLTQGVPDSEVGSNNVLAGEGTAWPEGNK